MCSFQRVLAGYTSGLVTTPRLQERPVTFQKLLKILHTLGAVGMMGAMVTLLVMLHHLPDPVPLEAYAPMRIAMGDISRWVLLPSIGMVLVGGLLAIGFNDAYHRAGWAWIKLATGIIVFEGSLTAIMGPLQRQARAAEQALAGEIDPASIEITVGSEVFSIWVMLAVAALNVVLGVLRPRTASRKKRAA